jgi:hypothetical protein
MKRILLGGLLGGIVLFVWGFVSWAVLPWHEATLNVVSNEDAVLGAIAANATKRGIYLIPGAPDTTGLSDEEAERREQEAMKKMGEGPFVFAAVTPGRSPGMGAALAGSFVIQFVSAALATFLLMRASAMPYLARTAFVMLLGLFAGIVVHLPHWNWWGFAMDYTLVGIADLVIGWFLAGLVVARATA